MVDIAPKLEHRHGSTTVGLRKRKDPSRTKPEVVRVVATDEKYRKALRHPITKKRFMADIGQSVEWPNDVCTYRMLRSGSVKLAEGEQAPQESQEPAAQGQAEQGRQQGRPEQRAPAPAPTPEPAKT